MRFLAICLFLLISVLPALAVDLPLQAQAQVGGEQVQLRDLLLPAAAARLARISGPIRLFRAPGPGLTRKVSRQTLARLVARQLKNTQLRLTGAASVVIARKGIWIEPVAMKKALQNYLLDAARKMPGVSLSFEKLYLPSRFMVAAGKVTYQVIPEVPRVIGSRRLTLITRVDDRVVANRSIRVMLKARAQVVVLTADLRRGERLSSSLLALQTRDISRLKEPFFTLEKLRGKRLKQAVRLGQPLQRYQVEFPPLIKRGARVTIQARKQGILLSARGEARQNGELGEIIRVRNNSSRREIPCRVQGAGLVSVEF